MTSYIRKVYFLVSRAVFVAYLGVSVYTYYEMRLELLDGEMEVKRHDDVDDGDDDSVTLYVPFMVCDPWARNGRAEVTSSFTEGYDGSWATSYDADDIGGCRVVKYLINACAGSIFVSAYAVLMYGMAEIYFVHDDNGRGGSARRRKFLAGMGTTICLLLVQSAVVVAGIAMEVIEAEESSTNLYHGELELPQADSAGIYIERVESHANAMPLFAYVLLALATSWFILVDTTVNFRIDCGGNDCYGFQNNAGTTDDEDDDRQRDQQQNRSAIEQETTERSKKEKRREATKSSPPFKFTVTEGTYKDKDGQVFVITRDVFDASSMETFVQDDEGVMIVENNQRLE